ncbi:hypothetical protein N7539_007814 [Penicillium diatomitis]|uniref:Meiotically up-regulated protein Msb1/Mug8 domain-containing protein n=1 Tax=Penicillium diatomitis TaxID=2819901 RepID=A0A9X0BNS3_9EURO|nr:uncharacterized protein N7539_007814 [Penicillium diatomitis]KAJ5475527.1 hypothetical protein N7539_007814 [Penicillium diatomitis]
MPAFFSRVFRSKDANGANKQAKPAAAANSLPARPKWTDAWARTEVAPEEVQDLVRGCAQEIKARALDTPFLLLPFRPSSDPSAARTFVRNYFNQSFDKGAPVSGDELMQELRLTEPMVLCSVLKWCWSRLAGGVVTWDAYELFKVGEQDSDFARDAFATFIPISVDSDARTKIIFDFFDLLASIAAHGKSNGLGGRKLSRYAGWWAFEHTDTGKGFEASYRNWAAAADATSHLFFAYLRSLAADATRGMTGISSLPLSLQTLVEATEYPPETPTLLQVTTTKVVMIVDTVSPTPFALLRRAKNFEYRDEHWHLQEFANFDDPVKALTDECLRVLRCISSANESSVSSIKQSTSLRDASWSRFQDIGFGGSIESDEEETPTRPSMSKPETFGGIRTAPHSQNGDLGRPTTPSWADFMSSGFADENLKDRVGPLLLPPDKILPPIVAPRGQSSQSHRRTMSADDPLEPAELASINSLDLDDSFWWVWISSLSADEPSARKAVFGRCALIETRIRDTKWLVLEEQVKGAAPEPEAGAHLVEKKRFFSFGSRRPGGKLSRSKSTAKKVSSIEDSYKRPNNQAPQSKSSIGPDQHKRIQAAAAALQRKHREQEAEARRSPMNAGDDTRSTKTNSVMTLQPAIVNEASSALKWASNYDKNAVRAAYLNDNRAGTGSVANGIEAHSNGVDSEQPPVSPVSPVSPTIRSTTKTGPPPPPPKDASAAVPPALPSPAPEPVQQETPREILKEGKNDSVKTVVFEDPAESQPKESLDDASKKTKKKTGNAGFKGMFGNKKKIEQQPQTELKPINGSKGNSAVAAARAALEAKAKESQNVRKSSPRPGVIKKKPVNDTPAPSVSSGPAPTPAAPASEPEPPTQAIPTPRATPEPTREELPSHSIPGSGSPPKTRRAIEADALSRVGTSEAAAAAQEFSKFDQGPLTEQPAFVPEDELVDAYHGQKDLPQTPTSVHDSGVAEKHTAINEASPSRFTSTEDRWAQIRRNAAERREAASAPVEEPEVRTSHSERTDEGDTSGEETIESRVARIKARVAELTGNMEAAR